jgi:hypothetical protein
MRSEALKGNCCAMALCPLVGSVPAPAVSSVTPTASSPMRAASASMQGNLESHHGPG